MITAAWDIDASVVKDIASHIAVPQRFYDCYGKDLNIVMFRQLDSKLVWQRYSNRLNSWWKVNETNVPTIIRMQAMLLR